MDATLDAMIGEGIIVAILARTSCGIYAGNYYDRIQKMFSEIVNGSLSTVITNEGATRGRFCHEVTIVTTVRNE